MASDILTISRRYHTRSDTAFRPRNKKNEANWQAYMGEQDFSYKAEFQSRETTPGFPIAVEHIVGTFERALTDSDDWMSTEAPAPAGQPLLDPDIIQGMLQHFLTRLWKPGNHPETAFGIQALVGDACKRGIMEPNIIAKVWPVLVKRKQFRFKTVKPDAEQGAFAANELLGEQLAPVDVETMRLAIELIPYADYFPDPSPACRYEIHRTRKALHELLANPDYDKDAVRCLLGKANEDYNRTGYGRDAERSVGRDPYDVDVFEAWGDVIDHETGEIATIDGVYCENVFWAWAGDQIIRKPTPNPYWGGTRPFVVAPLLRVPGSLEGKALADHAVPMWKAINELVNLLLDSAMKAAWGVGQVRPDLMESPEEIADGVPQGYTAVLKPNTPQGLKFYERVDNGEAPQISLENLTRLEGYLQTSLAMPDTKMGQLPQRQTKATEVVQAMQSAGSLYESFAARFEDTFLEPLFEKCWQLILQYCDDFLEDELVQILGPTNTLRLLDLSAAERFKLLSKASFKVRGLRGVASKERTFQKLMTIVNLLSSNQQFADNFGQKNDFTKLWDQLLRATGVDPSSLALDEEPEAAEEPVPGSEVAEQPEVAAGQLNPTLAPSSGASQPNVQGTPQAAAGAATAMAPNNPAGNQAVA